MAIQISDPDAVNKIARRIDKLEKKQAAWKAINKIAKSKAKSNTPEVKIKRLQEELGYSEEDAIQIMKPDFAGRIGIPQYELTNNNANIKRLKDQLAKAEALQKQEASETVRLGVTIERDPGENRIRLYFPCGRVDNATYQVLKRNGFKYARSMGCFSRYLATTNNFHLNTVFGAWKNDSNFKAEFETEAA